MKKISIDNLQVDEQLFRFVNEEAIPGTNINVDKTYSLNFSETDYDLSNFSTKTVTKSKIQEIDTHILYYCVRDLLLEKSLYENKIISNSENRLCNSRRDYGIG